MSEVQVDPPNFLVASPPQLLPWVEQIWYSRGELEVSRERVLPGASTDIVANLGPPMRLVEGDGVEHIIGTTVSGLLTKPIVLEHPAVHEAVGIRLSPHGIRAVLGVPAAALRDLVVDLPDVLESSIDELVQQCRQAHGGAARLQATMQWLSDRIARFGDTGDPLVRWATNAVNQTHGTIAIHTLQRESGYGATTFNQRFQDELGLTPKHYARLARFRAALDRLHPLTPLAELALDLGFTDQSHMNREFRLFGGTTPTEVLASRYPSGLTLAG